MHDLMCIVYFVFLYIWYFLLPYDCRVLAPRWNRVASLSSYFGSSACLQSLSSVLYRTAYGLESPQNRLGGTHAEGAGHPDKLTVHGWRWYYAMTISFKSLVSRTGVLYNEHTILHQSPNSVVNRI